MEMVITIINFGVMMRTKNIIVLLHVCETKWGRSSSKERKLLNGST